jgi:hypothetical protein
MRRMAIQKWKGALRGELVKIGARLVSHTRRPVVELAEVSVRRDLFAQILSPIRRLPPVPTWGPPCVAVLAAQPVVFTDPEVPSRLVSSLGINPGSRERHEYCPNRLHEGELAGKAGVCGSHSEFGHRIGVSRPTTGERPLDMGNSG